MTPGPFGELRRLTAPRVEYRDLWWPTFSWLSADGESRWKRRERRAAPASTCSVSQRIGPFDVARLAADDAAALAKWLADKGFPHPDGLDLNLEAVCR